MPKVLFDHQKFTTQRYGGISRYFANIIKYIETDADFTSELGIMYCQNHYLNSNSNSFDELMNKLLKNQKLTRKLYQVNQAYSQFLVKKNHFDIFHPTYYDSYFIGDIKKPFVTTIHDMTYEKLPEYFWAHDELTRNKRLHVINADAIIAISETTKSDLMEYHNVSESKISVIYHGIDPDIPLVFDPIPDLPKEFLLYVGDRSGYKNFFRFINVFKKIVKKFPDYKLILTGGGSLGTAEKEYLLRLKLQNSVRHVNVTDAELNTLYNNTKLFIYPSLHEGFGLPILEAFKANCPVLLSNTPCFKEIGKDAVNYFEPYSEEDLEFQITKMLDHPEIGNKLILAGRKRMLDFPMDRSINETIALYSNLTQKI